jgi:hypothetical protein
MLLTSCPPSSTDGAAVSLVAASGMTASNRDGVAVGIATSSGTTLALDSVATALMTITRNEREYGGAAVSSITAASGTTAVPSMIFSTAKTILRAYFKRVDWPLNKALPRGAEFLNGPLRDIVKQQGLEEAQEARQLLNYKRGKYTQVSILLNPPDLDERLCKGIGCTSWFVSSTLRRIYSPKEDSSSDFRNLCRVVSSLPATACTYIHMLANSSDTTCFRLFVDVVKNWIQCMAEGFPKTAAGVANAQVDFEREKEHKMHAFIDEFIKEYKTFGIHPAELSSNIFRRLGAFLHLALFHAWSDAICVKDKPPIEFPTTCLVGKYAMPVVYYVAGWILYSASKALTIAADKRQLYFRFAASHTINEKEAKAVNLPTSLVERRKKRASVYCSREYFDFILIVESVFLANLLLKMMLVFNDGDIVARIKTSIVSHEATMDVFFCLAASEDDDDNKLLLAYIIERHTNMQGTYFVRHLKGNSGNQVQKLADCQATRTKVAHAVVYAKKGVKSDDHIVVTDYSAECHALWENAAENVFELADNYEVISSNE